MKNTFLGVLAIGAILGTAAFFGYTPFMKIIVQQFGSSAGTTYNTAKYAGIVMNLATAGANATSSSILNTDSGTRYVTGTRVGCNAVGTSLTAYTGAGLAALTLTVATSSTSAPGTLAEYAPVVHAFTIPTSTSDYVLASSTTQTATSTKATPWHTGEYMTFAFNATNTAACTVGVDYIGS